MKFYVKEERKRKVPECIELIGIYCKSFGITQENATNNIDKFALSNPKNIPITSMFISDVDKRIGEFKALFVGFVFCSVIV